MTTEEKNLIKATIPILQVSGNDLIKYFYERMFRENPELKNVFNMTNQATGKQQNALTNAVLAYAENIDNPSVLINVLKSIGNKHVSLNITRDQYDIVGNHLINSIKEVLGNIASEEILNAWTLAYTELAEIMIEIEESMYKENAEKKGGWNGWRQFEIIKIEEETSEIKSFYFAPTDKKEIAVYKPGQYISVKTKIDASNSEQIRQYSLSSNYNENFYRVSIKKEINNNNPDGLVSNIMHIKNVGDIIELTPPAGVFCIDNDQTHPTVLISGGIGQTPLLSILETNYKLLKNTKTIWIHACRNNEMHAFQKEIDKIDRNSDWLKTFIYYENNNNNIKNVAEGRIDLIKIKEEILIDGAKYYICGPVDFIKSHYKSLVNLGVERDKILYEEFGPGLINLN